MSRMPSSRIIFLDNLRYSMIVLVVLFHTMLGYVSGFRWYVSDPNSIMLTGLFVSLLDVFMMPVLFFIAGYFALHSIIHKNAPNFASGKLKRLGIPLLITAAVFNPVVSFVGQSTISGTINLKNYPSFWLKNIESIADPGVGVLDVQQTVTDGTFILQHLWFLAVLLTVFLIFALAVYIYTTVLKQKITISDSVQGKWTVRVTLGTFLAVSFGSFLLVNLSLPEIALFSDTPYWKITPLYVFQPTRMAVYICYFILGLYACRHRWFELGSNFPGALFWIIPLALSLLIMLGSMGAYYEQHIRSIKLIYWYSLAHTATCFSLTGLLLSLARSRWNNRGKAGAFFSANSYNIYLTHLAIVVSFLYAFSHIPQVPSLVKMTAVFFLSLMVSALLSRFVIGTKRFEF